MNIKAANMLTEMNGSTEKVGFVKQNAHLQMCGVEEEKTEEAEATLSISEVGKLKAQNNREMRKQSSVTSAKEKWEEDAVRSKLREDMYGNFDRIETMRIDEPETYAKYKEKEKIRNEACQMIEDEEERRKVYEELRSASVHIWLEWFERRCMPTGWAINPVKGGYASLDAIEDFLSDDRHATSVNVYNDETEGDEKEENLWRAGTKFNVLISRQMFETLDKIMRHNKMSQEEQDQMNETANRIVNATREIQEVEKKYEGDLKYLRFGVKLQDDGTVTYHANYAGCENADGIMADSADELLKMLMEK